MVISLYKIKIRFQDLNHQEYTFFTEKLAHNREEALIEGLSHSSLLDILTHRYLKIKDWEVVEI